MHLRRSFAAAAATALLALPALSACGFDSNTDRVNNNTAGTIDQSGVVDIVAATVVASEPDRGTLVANLSNNDQAGEAVLVSVESGAGDDTVAAEFEEITIPPGGYVNLADDAAVTLTGSFGVGDLVSLAIGFEGGETITLDVPVVRACDEYAGLEPASEVTASEPTSAATASEPSTTAAPDDEPTLEAEPAESTEPVVGEPEETDEAYSCEPTESETEE